MATGRTTQKVGKNPRSDKSELPVLTLRVEGPSIRSGSISVPDLIRICQDAQTAVTRQAEALEGRNTLHPGPTTDRIRHECTLELIGIGKGSTTLHFGLAKPQLTLPLDEARHFGAEVVEELATTIRSLGNGNRKKDLDPGVLQSIYGLGSLVETGRVTKLEWIAPKRARKKLSAFVSKKARERAAAQLSGPRFKITQVDGVLDMADFSRRDRKCRIDPAIGAPVLCSFGPEHENAVQELLRQPVRVIGLGRIQPNADRVDSLQIRRIAQLPSLSLGAGDFFSPRTIEQLAAAQGVGPVCDPRVLAGMLNNDEVDDFISEIYQAREKS